MFIRRDSKSKAVASVEYMALIVFILGAFLVFQRYIYRGFAGGWKRAGDAFGQGRQYDPRPFGVTGLGGGTFDCFFDYVHCKPGRIPPCYNNADRMNAWIDKSCTETPTGGRPYRCDCTLPFEDPQYDVRCLQCYANCPCPYL